MPVPVQLAPRIRWRWNRNLPGERVSKTRAAPATDKQSANDLWANSGSVVLTREAGKNGRVLQALQMRGIPCKEVPMVKSVPGPDTEELPRLLKSQVFDWVALTSPEAAAVFLRAWEDAHRPSVRLTCVGAGTARILQAHRVAPEVVFMPSVANAAAFSQELPLAPDCCKVLYPASARAGTTLQDGLSRRGFDVVRVNTYSTAAVEQGDVSAGDLDALRVSPVVAIASPSALSAWAALIGFPAAQEKAIACIGSTSGNAALDLGFQRENVWWPTEPGLPGFVDAICSALDAKTTQ